MTKHEETIQELVAAVKSYLMADIKVSYFLKRLENQTWKSGAPLHLLNTLEEANKKAEEVLYKVEASQRNFFKGPWDELNARLDAINARIDGLEAIVNTINEKE